MAHLTCPFVFSLRAVRSTVASPLIPDLSFGTVARGLPPSWPARNGSEPPDADQLTTFPDHSALSVDDNPEGARFPKPSSQEGASFRQDGLHLSSPNLSHGRLSHRRGWSKVP